MLISEISKRTKLTKKAIEYYLEQGLIDPIVLENGYRDFSQSDLECLTKISIFRKLGLTILDIKNVLADETGNALQKIAIQKNLNVQREYAKKSILDKLCRGTSDSEVNTELESIEQNSTIIEKLLETFPGYYGRFICLHFARFLNNPITTEEQYHAYDEIIAFLDNVSSFVFPDDLQTFLDESTTHYGVETISTALENVKLSIENIDNFLYENKDELEQYLKFKQSEEYKNSPLCKIQVMLKEFNNANGYYDVFIPAMEKISRPYAKYIRQMKLANEKLISQYPQIERWST